ncbi:MAG TPA: alanine dehydrogenase, partial [Dermatophilaceae bacterium]|nr:alanine dehydrogenase [Dermatophilaceae bacterium]
TNATLSYAVKLADKGWKGAIGADQALALGLNTHDGFVTYKAVADDLDLPYRSLADVLA